MKPPIMSFCAQTRRLVYWHRCFLYRFRLVVYLHICFFLCVLNDGASQRQLVFNGSLGLRVFVWHVTFIDFMQFSLLLLLCAHTLLTVLLLSFGLYTIPYTLLWSVTSLQTAMEVFSSVALCDSGPIRLAVRPKWRLVVRPFHKEIGHLSFVSLLAWKELNSLWKDVNSMSVCLLCQ